MREIRIKSKDFFDPDIEKLSLSILINQDGFSYSVFNEDEKQYVGLISNNFKTNQDKYSLYTNVFEKDKLTHPGYNSKIIFSTFKKSIVPKSIFQKDKISHIFKLSHFLNDNEILLYNQIDDIDAIIIYDVDKNEYEFIKNHFPKAEIFCDASVFVENSLLKLRNDENISDSKVFVNIASDFFDVLVFNDELKLFNSFKFKSANDFLYHLVNIFNQLRLKSDTSQVEISGFIDPADISIINLRKFIANIYFTSLNRKYKYYYRFQEILPHYFSIILNS